MPLKFLLAVIGCVVGMGAAPLPARGSQAPVNESLDLGMVTLNRMQLHPLKDLQPGLLPARAKDAAALPASVTLYLKPTRQIDTLSRAVERAANQVRRAVAPKPKDKDKLRDSRALVAGVDLWLDANLVVDPAQAPNATVDLRKQYPPVSQLLKAGKTDVDGRALVQTALLRALRIPCRVALAQGRLVAQVWVPLQAPPRSSPAAHKRAKTRTLGVPPRPLGWWESAQAGVQDADIEAWSLDAFSLQRLRWKPQQELQVTQLGWEQAAFAEGDSLAAHAAFDASLAAGRLSATAQAQALSVAAAAAFQSLTQGTRTLWVLSVQRTRLQVQGAMGAMERVQLITPYRPDLRSWGREVAPSVAGMDIEAQGVWSDRPQRIRTFADAELQNDWESPPPAQGMLHWYDLGIRRHETVLQASRRSGGVEGVVLRCDNLSPRQGMPLVVEAEGLTESARGTVAADGSFHINLGPEWDAQSCIEVRAGSLNAEGDAQRLLSQP